MNDQQYYFANLLIPFLEQELEKRAENCSRKPFADLIRLAHSYSIKTHFLKRLDNPRILWAVNKLKGLWPTTLLDIGSGNGYLLWYLTENIPGLKIYSAEKNRKKADRISRVASASKINIHITCSNGEALPFKDNSFEAVTFLEVLEHTPNPGKLISEALRVSWKWIIASVPSKPDNNPQHIHLFSKNQLKELFKNAGGRVRWQDFDSGIPNHYCWIAKTNRGG